MAHQLHFNDATGVVGDGAEGIHGQHVCGRGENAHGGDGSTVEAA